MVKWKQKGLAINYYKKLFNMATQVIKKDGTKEPFDSGKIKRAIEAAAREAGLMDEQVNAAVIQISGIVMALADSKEEIATSELRDKILSELDNVQPAAAAAWRKHAEG